MDGMGHSLGNVVHLEALIHILAVEVDGIGGLVHHLSYLPGGEVTVGKAQHLPLVVSDADTTGILPLTCGEIEALGDVGRKLSSRTQNVPYSERGACTD